MIDVPASRFLRPVRGAWYESFQLDRIAGQMTAAAKSNKLFHLWWHPHNFGADPEPNLVPAANPRSVRGAPRQVRHAILEHVGSCRTRPSMSRVIVLTCEGEFGRIAANYLAPRFPGLVTIVDAPLSRFGLLRGRARRLGAAVAAGQAAFMAFQRLQRLYSGAGSKRSSESSTSTTVRSRPMEWRCERRSLPHFP